jgi:hypothetical protein
MQADFRLKPFSLASNPLAEANGNEAAIYLFPLSIWRGVGVRLIVLPNGLLQARADLRR